MSFLILFFDASKFLNLVSQPKLGGIALIELFEKSRNSKSSK